MPPPSTVPPAPRELLQAGAVGTELATFSRKRRKPMAVLHRHLYDITGDFIRSNQGKPFHRPAQPWEEGPCDTGPSSLVRVPDPSPFTHVTTRRGEVTVDTASEFLLLSREGRGESSWPHIRGDVWESGGKWGPSPDLD